MNKLLATTLVSIGIAAAVPAAFAQTAAPAADGGRGQFAQRQSEQRYLPPAASGRAGSLFQTRLRSPLPSSRSGRLRQHAAQASGPMDKRFRAARANGAASADATRRCSSSAASASATAWSCHQRFDELLTVGSRSTRRSRPSSNAWPTGPHCRGRTAPRRGHHRGGRFGRA